MTHAYEVIESRRPSMPVGERFLSRKLDHDEEGIYYFTSVKEDERGRTILDRDAKVRYLGQIKVRDPQKKHAALMAL